MGYLDVRDWMKAAEQDGELRRIEGVDANLEMSGIVEIFYRETKPPVPALLFDEIPGYPAGFRTLFGCLSSPKRLTRALGLPVSGNTSQVIESWRTRMRGLKPIAPEFVSSAPILENRLQGGNVNVEIFPSPRFHELDGGRYIGTCHAVILKDPETGWVNLGTYRCMLVDPTHLAVHMLEGQHGSIICEKYVSRKEAVPVAVAIGLPPILYFAASEPSVPFGVSEYDYAGGIAGEAIRVIEGQHTGLPLPADAEIVIEGEWHPGELIDEGPFGEWNGYYANCGLSPVSEPLIRVKAVYYRNDPVLTCSAPSMPPSELSAATCITRSAMFWEKLEGFGIPGIKGVWCHDEGGSLLLTVVAIRQLYAGHSKRVGLIASHITPTLGRYTVVVDEDIDPSNLSQVMWAVATRTDPANSIQTLSHCGTSSADPAVTLSEKMKIKKTPKPLYSSRAVIDACQPFEAKDEWYPVARITDELRNHLVTKWKHLFSHPL